MSARPARYLEQLRATPPTRRLEIAAGLTVATRTLAIAGLRRRHPLADDAELRRRLVVLLYGEAEAARIDRLLARREAR